MLLTDDSALLRQYAENHSDEAFAGLVTRHINLVYSVALRQVGDPYHAEEVTQAVFIILAKKAGQLRHDKALSSWLFQATRLTAGNFVRSETRRHRREQEAYMQSTLNESGDDVWPSIAPLLDAGVAGLSETDRRAIVLRFYEGRSVREVGAALGASEDAAEKRVTRAVERLRTFFTKRGVMLTAAAIAEAVSANSVQAAPVGLAVTVAATAAKGAAVGGSTLTLVKGALKIMAWTKAKTAIVVGAGVLLAAGTTTVIICNPRSHARYPWQVPEATFDVLYKLPAEVRIVPTVFPKDGGYVADRNKTWGLKALGIAQPVKRILGVAYSAKPARMTINAELPIGRYDFIATQPQNSAKALQDELKNLFGVVGKKQMDEADVWVLRLKRANAPLLADSTGPQPKGTEDPLLANRMAYGNGVLIGRNQMLDEICNYVESHFEIPVINRTGLTNKFDFELKWDEPNYLHTNLESFKGALIDQLGLELVPSREPIEMLVVEKAK